ncbi:MAG TPA: hypothetical protein VF628_09595 [Allosphingosinicella sp.]
MVWTGHKEHDPGGVPATRLGAVAVHVAEAVSVNEQRPGVVRDQNTNIGTIKAVSFDFALTSTEVDEQGRVVVISGDIRAFMPPECVG